jgi:hypothetical protein
MKLLAILLLFSVNAFADVQPITTSASGTGFSEASACAMAEQAAWNLAEYQCANLGGKLDTPNFSSVAHRVGNDVYSCSTDCTALCEY